MSDFGPDYVSQNGGGAAPAGGSAATPVTYIYWPGATDVRQAVGLPHGGGYTAGDQRYVGSDLMSAEDAAFKILDWRRNDPAKYQAVVDQMKKYGLVPTDASLAQVEQVWQSAIGYSAVYTAQGMNTSPEDAFAFMGNPQAESTALQPGESKLDQTSSSVDLMSGSQSRGLINDAFHKALGRQATDKEARKFAAAINSAIRANPNVSSTTSSMDMAGQVSQATTSSGGVDVAQIAQDTAMKNPEFAGYKATSLLDTFASILGPAVNL